MLRENLNKAYLVRSKVFVLKNKAWALVAINLIPTLGRQKQAVLMSSRSAWSTEQVPGQVLLLLRNHGSKTHNGEIEGDRETETEE